jgi:hypothetical protein
VPKAALPTHAELDLRLTTANPACSPPSIERWCGVQVCKSVDVYGFTPYRDEDRFDPLATKYHYFDGAVPREHSHSFDLARYLYQLLSYQFPSFNIYD